MCGIFAYLGKGDASQIVLQGLKDLEYRGYDSWGIAVTTARSLVLTKRVGSIKEVELPSIDSRVALGHTRWATHGGVTTRNAHPHLDCNRKIAVVHNGIIENHSSIKKTLLSLGHKFRSGTDTEVFPHLVEEKMRKLDFQESVRLSFSELSGFSTVVALDIESGEIVAFKNGSPLVVGMGKDGSSLYLSSDVPSLLTYTNKILVLKDMEGVAMKNGSINLIHTNSSRSLRPRFSYVRMDQDPGSVEKGSYPHSYLKEIHDQPESLTRLLQSDQKLISQIADILRFSSSIFAVACGTAHYATLALSYIFSRVANRSVIPLVGSEFSSFAGIITRKDAVIFASQSGETIDTINALRLAKQQRAKTISLVNVPLSTLSREADFTLPLRAGVEKAVVSTKAFTNKLALATLLAHSLAGSGDHALVKIRSGVNGMREMFKGGIEKEVREISRSLIRDKILFVVGRGANYPVALEGALKIKESSYIHAEGLPAGELKHGAIALIEKDTPCIVVASDDSEYSATISGAEELKARGARIIGISPIREAVFDSWINTPKTSLSMAVNTLPLQLFGYFLATQKGLNPDRPRNLAKSVTVK